MPLRPTPAAALVLALAFAAGPGAPARGAPAANPRGLDRLQHLVVIYLENRSFDNLYGEFAGADGLANAGAAATQVDSAGAPYATLPPVPAENGHGLDPHFPATLANRPFCISDFLPPDQPTRDLVHRFYQEQVQIDGGRMDRFACVSTARALSMGFYHTRDLPLATVAREYTLCDRFFHAAFGGSWLNHIWLVAAATPRWPSPPAGAFARLDAAGHLVHDGAVTPDSFVVNNVVPTSMPHPAHPNPNIQPPEFDLPTIGDRLSAKGVSWAWYSGGWSDALAGHPDRLFEFHHQPFAYFANYADSTPARRAHLFDESEFLPAVKAGTLPAVAFLKPIGALNEHPGYTDVLSGERHVIELLHALEAGPLWRSTAVIITYDENGGLWDHVAPPAGDRWGPGTRVPAIVVAPFAKRHFVDHTTYDTTSILALIEHRWGLPPLGPRDAAAADLTHAFDLGR